ncbi:hypothetical protein BV898_18244 [Hypsibius exemplaris]|uniref:Uncharacterized protein n=1 Tax=Hypsibius exemplaris TaxID=2072580 RepID=A0A9X6NH09_HYPEX|nr:hypothetical protein BV898_18244 [Hypsibius exemplaris]
MRHGYYQLDTTNGVRRVFYEIKGARTPESWTKFCKKSHPVGVMFFAGICWRGVTTHRFIEHGAKINSDDYIKHCLKPLIEVDIPPFIRGRNIKSSSTKTPLQLTPPKRPKNTFWNPG